jgi:hypothetical protein
MNPFWPLLGEAVREPLPHPWQPRQVPVDRELLKRVIAGLELLSAQNTRRNAQPNNDDRTHAWAMSTNRPSQPRSPH